MPSKIRIAMVGCGWAAEGQMERGFSALTDRFAVGACCDANAARASVFAGRYGIPGVEPDYEHVLARPDIDAVSICTPPSLHHAMVMGALAAGKDVICEKPFTSSMRLVDEIITADARSTHRVMPIFQYRFAPGIERIRHLIGSGLPGKAFVSSVETAWLREAGYYAVPWRGKSAMELGGVLLTQAIHIHDLFTWLMGPAASVKAFKATLVNPIEVEDCAVASLTMRDGSLASLVATLGSRRPVTRIRLCFEHLTIERECFDAEAIRPGFEPWTIDARSPEIEAEARTIMAAARIGPADYAGQFADFHAAIRDNRPFAVTLDDARRSLELVTALFHASETDETVGLPIDADHPRYGGWRPAHD